MGQRLGRAGGGGYGDGSVDDCAVESVCEGLGQCEHAVFVLPENVSELPKAADICFAPRIDAPASFACKSNMCPQKMTPPSAGEHDPKNQ